MKTKQPIIPIRLKQNEYNEVIESSKKAGYKPSTYIKRRFFEKNPPVFLVEHEQALRLLNLQQEISEQFNQVLGIAQGDGLANAITLLTDIADNQRILTNLIGTYCGND